MSYEMGALIEPLSVGVHAARRADIDIGSSVLITGAGPIGMLSAIAARAKGACDIWITDVIDSRLGKQCCNSVSWPKTAVTVIRFVKTYRNRIIHCFWRIGQKYGIEYIECYGQITERSEW